MKKFYFLIMTLISFNIIATTLQNNVFCAKNGGIEFESAGAITYSITNGQPWSGGQNNYYLAGVNYSNKGCIQVNAGRDNNSSNVDWVEKQLEYLSLQSVFGVPTQGGDKIGRSNPVVYEMPKKLNFAVLGNMILTQNGASYLCKNVIIGQGSYSGGDNWWVWGNAYYGNNSETALFCNNMSNNTGVYFTLKGSGINIMDFELVN